MYRGDLKKNLIDFLSKLLNRNFSQNAECKNIVSPY